MKPHACTVSKPDLPHFSKPRNNQKFNCGLLTAEMTNTINMWIQNYTVHENICHAVSSMRMFSGRTIYWYNKM